MKKVLVSVVALTALAGCAGYYDYYKSDVRYVQDGEDCIYYAGEDGRHFTGDMKKLNNDKKVVYHNTRCRDLYRQDNAGIIPTQERKVFVPTSDLTPLAPSCGCQAECPRQTAKRRYVIMPA